MFMESLRSLKKKKKTPKGNDTKLIKTNQIQILNVKELNFEIYAQNKLHKFPFNKLYFVITVFAILHFHVAEFTSWQYKSFDIQNWQNYQSLTKN